MQPQGRTTQAAAGPTKEDAPPTHATPLPMTDITPTLAPPPGQLQHAILLLVPLQLRASIFCHLERRAVIVALATAPISQRNLLRTCPASPLRHAPTATIAHSNAQQLKPDAMEVV